MNLNLVLLFNGGEGSGDFGHYGRPGEVGGSAPSGSPSRTSTPKKDKKTIKPKSETTKKSTSKTVATLDDEYLDSTKKVTAEEIGSMTDMEGVGYDWKKSEYYFKTEEARKECEKRMKEFGDGDNSVIKDEAKEKLQADTEKKLGTDKYKTLQKAGEYYAYKGNEEINNTLRKGEKLTGEAAEQAKTLAELCETFSSKKAMSTYRGEISDKDYYSSIKVGESLPATTSKAFVSTTTSVSRAAEFADEYEGNFRTIFKFNVPKGKKFGAVDAYSDKYDESEILFAPGLKTKVKAVYENQSGRNPDQLCRLIVVDILPD